MNMIMMGMTVIVVLIEVVDVEYEGCKGEGDVNDDETDNGRCGDDDDVDGDDD